MKTMPQFPLSSHNLLPTSGRISLQLTAGEYALAGGVLQEYLSSPSHNPASDWQPSKPPIEDMPAVSSSTRQPHTNLDSLLPADRTLPPTPSPGNPERHADHHSLVSPTNETGPPGGWAALAEVFTVAVLTRGLHNPSGALDWLESRKHGLTSTDQEVRQTRRRHGTRSEGMRGSLSLITCSIVTPVSRPWAV